MTTHQAINNPEASGLPDIAQLAQLASEFFRELPSVPGVGALGGSSSNVFNPSVALPLGSAHPSQATKWSSASW